MLVTKRLNIKCQLWSLTYLVLYAITPHERIYKTRLTFLMWFPRTFRPRFLSILLLFFCLLRLQSHIEASLVIFCLFPPSFDLKYFVYLPQLCIDSLEQKHHSLIAPALMCCRNLRLSI